MDVRRNDIVLEFRKYNGAHPLKLMSLLAFDEKGDVIKDKIVENVNLINSIQAIGRALQLLAYYDKNAYYDMVRNKLAAKHGTSYDLHNLISAFCELSIMNSFISSSSTPESFIYEDRLNPSSKKNVEFTIKIADYLFHVEVKTSNLVSEDQKIAEMLKENPKVMTIDGRADNYEELKNNIDIPTVGCLDRRLVDFLKSANEKFTKTNNPKEVNLLIICWDDRIQQPLMALKSPKHKGILTKNSFMCNDDGSPILFPNVDCVLVNTNYELFKRYAADLLFQNFSLSYPVDPFFQLFAENALLDYNLTDELIELIQSILKTKVVIVDETLADSFKDTAIATMKKGEENVIRFD